MLPSQFLHVAPRWQQCVTLVTQVHNKFSALTTSRLPSYDCSIAGLDLGFLHPVPRSHLMCLFLEVTPLVFSWQLAFTTLTFEVLLSLPPLSAFQPYWKSWPNGSLQQSVVNMSKMEFIFIIYPSPPHWSLHFSILS